MRNQNHHGEPQSFYSLARLHDFGRVVLPIHRLLARFFLVALLLDNYIATASTGFNLAPSILTNNYFGSINITITNLPSNGQTVRVEKFYDLNGNGIVATNDWLVQSFIVTDGTMPTIGGVTNLNVPGDTDGTANGQIVVQLNYPGIDRTFNLIEGSYLFRVSSPSNTFPSITQSFRVLQQTNSQVVAGTIYSGAIANIQTNALVLAFDDNFNILNGTKANANGRYSLYVPSGDVTVWPFLKGYIAGQSDGFTNVVSGQTVTNLNIAMIPATNFIAGVLADAASSNGLPGVAIYGYQSNYFSITFTDPNGNYSQPVSASTWSLQYNPDQMPMLGYLSVTDMFTTNVKAYVTNFSLPATKANALLYGAIYDDQTPSNNVAQVLVYASDNQGYYQNEGLTYGSNGLYSIGVVASNWWVQPDADTLAGLGYLSPGTNWAIRANQAVRMDLIVKKITAHIQGTTADDSGAESYVGLQATDPTHAWVVNATSDENGNYNLGLFGGTWQISLDSDTASSWDGVGTNLLVTVTNGQSVLNRTYLFHYANAYLSGSISNSAGGSVNGIAVHGTATLPTVGNYNFVTYTDNNGLYYSPILAGIAGTRWTNTFDCFGYDGLTFSGYTCLSPVTTGLIQANASYVINTIFATPLASPSLTSPTMSPAGVFGFNVSGPTNPTYQVIASTNLIDWSTVYVTNPVSGAFRFNTTNLPSIPARLFRTVLQ